ncbi:MAG: hypothetical protein KDA42_11505, partial [Planctomycetales bacterium]|nr:hypothetical protein [Planctomycetales bacterium]
MMSRFPHVRWQSSACLLAVAMTLMAPTWASAQVDGAANAEKTVAVLAFSSYDEIIGDVGMLGELGGNPGLAQFAEGSIALFTGGRGLIGIDKSKPWGTIVTTKGDDFKLLSVIPVNSLDEVVTTLAPLTGGEKPEKDDDGIYEVKGDGDVIF